MISSPFRYLLMLLLMAASVPAIQARHTIADDINAAEGSITIEQPAELNILLEYQEPEVKAPSSTTPSRRHVYRVQVFSSNEQATAQTKARQRRQQIAARFSEYPIYVTPDPPYWRVRVGDFRTLGEAEDLLISLKRAFPKFAGEMIIVPDVVTK